MERQRINNTRIYVIFFTSGLQDECRSYPIYHPDIKIVKNQEILEIIKDKCEGVEFVGETDPVRAEEVRAKIKKQRKNLDGLLVFDLPPYSGQVGVEHIKKCERDFDELTSLDLPVVAVYRMWGRWMPPFNAYKKKKVVTSFLPIIRDKDPHLYSLRIEDIARKVRLVDAIARMRK